MKMDKERMREYQKERRAKLKGVIPKEKSLVDCQGCVSLRALVLKLETEVVLLRGREPILRTKDDAKKVVSMLPVREGRVAHHPACGCMMCRPPKVEKGS